MAYVAQAGDGPAVEATATAVISLMRQGSKAVVSCRSRETQLLDGCTNS